MSAPQDIRKDEILRLKIIKEILDDKNFMEDMLSNPLRRKTKKELAMRVNEYAVRHGLWEDNVKLEMLTNALGVLMGKRIK